MKNTKKAFTLVELLIVVAIIGVLASLLMPALSKSRNKVTSMQSKTFLSGLASSLGMYREEYGSFPAFLSQSERVNLNDGNNAEALVKTLSGRSPEGSVLTKEEKRAYNRNAAVFLTFANENLVQRGEDKSWKLIDAFENPNIYVCVDNTGAGRIKQGYPTEADGLTIADSEEIVPNKSIGIGAHVILFTLKKDEDRDDADYSAENVYSWK